MLSVFKIAQINLIKIFSNKKLKNSKLYVRNFVQDP